MILIKYAGAIAKAPHPPLNAVLPPLRGRMMIDLFFNLSPGTDDLAPLAADVSSIVAVQWRNSRSGSFIGHSRRNVVDSAARPGLLPFFCEFFARKIRNSAALPLFPAVHNGDKILNCANFNV